MIMEDSLLSNIIYLFVKISESEKPLYALTAVEKTK